MTWHTGPLCALDFESTGISMWADRIVSYCVGRVGGAVTPEIKTGLCNPGIPIPAGATAVHGITDEHAQAAPPARDVVDRIARELVTAQLEGVPIVGWNVSYDLTLLTSELGRHGLPSLEQRLHRPVGPVLDGFVLDKHVDPYRRGSRKLEVVARHYGVPMADGAAHGAEADALTAARIVYRIAVRYPEVGGSTLLELHDLQVEWAREQADSLRAYFDRAGTAHDGVDGHWPIRERTEAVAA